SQYITVLARQFPARLKKVSANQFEQILKPIGDGQFNTLSAAYAVQALKAYSHVIAQNPPQLTIDEVHSDKREVNLASAARLLQRASFSKDATALRFKSSPPIAGPGAFYQVLEAGYDRRPPDKPLNEGLEVFRELLDKDNKPVTSTKIGKSVHVRVRVRSTNSD